MALEEDKKSGSWKEKNVCMGDTKTCSFPGLINQHHKFIISFAEDEAGGFVQSTANVNYKYDSNYAAEKHSYYICFFLKGELYFLATSYPSAMSPFGTLYKFMDPSR